MLSASQFLNYKKVIILSITERAIKTDLKVSSAVEDSILHHRGLDLKFKPLGHLGGREI